MFQRLAETRRTTNRSFLRESIASLAAHGALLVGAGYFVTTAGHTNNTVKVDTTTVFLTPAPVASTPQPVELDVPVKGFQTLTVPLEIPTSIPAVDLTQRFDPRDYSGVGVEGGRSDGAATAPAVYSEAVVQEAPALLSGPPPYPAVLREAGVHGRVVIQAIVDTAGRLEPASVKIVTSADPAFNEPTLRWALKARFRPARLEGRPVRVLVNLPIDFAVPGG